MICHSLAEQMNYWVKSCTMLYQQQNIKISHLQLSVAKRT